MHRSFTVASNRAFGAITKRTPQGCVFAEDGPELRLVRGFNLKLGQEGAHHLRMQFELIQQHVTRRDAFAILEASHTKII